MTTSERQILNARLGELLHTALVNFRAMSFSEPHDGVDRRDEMNDLADLLHNIPRFIVGHDEYALDSLSQFREAVIEHVKRFYPNIDPVTHRYVVLLDMDAETLLRQYRDHQWDTAESVSAAM